MIHQIPVLSVERLSQYRRVLVSYQYVEDAFIFSHHLSRHVKTKPATVRRDLMLIGVIGDLHRGYKVSEVLEKIGEAIDPPGVTAVCFVGMGHLGRTMMDYLNSHNSHLQVVASFSLEESEISTYEPPSYLITEISQVIKEKAIKICALAVPVEYCKEVSLILVNAGITAILNFSPMQLQPLKGITVENIDIVSKLERMAYEAKIFAGDNA